MYIHVPQGPFQINPPSAIQLTDSHNSSRFFCLWEKNYNHYKIKLSSFNFSVKQLIIQLVNLQITVVFICKWKKKIHFLLFAVKNVQLKSDCLFFKIKVKSNQIS